MAINNNNEQKAQLVAERERASNIAQSYCANVKRKWKSTVLTEIPALASTGLHSSEILTSLVDLDACTVYAALHYFEVLGYAAWHGTRPGFDCINRHFLFLLSPLWGFRGKVGGSSQAHWKPRMRLPIRHNWTFFARCFRFVIIHAFDGQTDG